MIDFHTYSQIHRLDEQHLNAAQIAEALHLDPRTVTHWLTVKRFQVQKRPTRSSKLDPFKADIARWLDQHPLSAQQVLQRVRELGYTGGYTILRLYVRQIRPKKPKAYLTLSFQPGECAQVDWGQFGSVTVGNTQRRLSFFVMVLCYSRMLYVEFTVSQTMEHFLACHQHAFEVLGVPEKIMVDNLKSAVLRRELGEPVLNPVYLDFAQHCGFKIRPCNVRAGNEKGRVESAVGYVKKNFLNGLTISDAAALNPMVRHWLAQVANVRIHGETHQRPVDLYAQERDRLNPLPLKDYDVGRVYPVRASSRFRVTFETNRYSVPSEFARCALLLKAYPDRLCLYHQERLIARHARCYDRHQDFEHPDHPKELLQQRRRARDQKLLARFLGLCSQAPVYFHELEQRRLNARLHALKIVALSDIHGEEAVVRALQDTLAFGAFGSEYIANLLQQRAQTPISHGVLHLTRSQDLLDLELADPDLNDYDLPEYPHE